MPGPELVAVQRQAGLEPQRVARAEPGGRDPGARRTASQSAGASAAGTCDLDAVLARVAGAGDDAASPHARRTANRGTAAASGSTVGEQRARLRALHREHRARRGDVGELDRAVGRVAPRRTRRAARSVFDAFGITKKRSASTHHTMMSSTTCASAGSSRCVYCARPGSILRRSLVSSHCSSVERARPRALDRAEVRHVEHDRARRGTPGARRARRAYCSGMSQPPNGTMRAPSARCCASSGL